MFQHKNYYYLFWALLKSIGTPSIGHQRGIVELVNIVFQIGRSGQAPAPLGVCAFEALWQSGWLCSHSFPFLLLLCPSGSLSIHPPLTAYHQNQDKDIDWHLLRVCNRKGYGTFPASFTHSNRAGCWQLVAKFPILRQLGRAKVPAASREACAASFLRGRFLEVLCELLYAELLAFSESKAVFPLPRGK